MPPLHPFRATPELQGIELDGDANWGNGLLQLAFRLSAPQGQLILPARADQPARRDELWQHTCFEAFLALPGEQAYWEINCSPSGDWNVYRLSGYRQNLTVEPRVTALPMLLRRHGQDLELELELELEPLIPPERPLELSLTAVMEHPHIGCSYWAWRHCGPEPDFHLRESFQPLAVQPRP